jgi:basic membrane protein A
MGRIRMGRRALVLPAAVLAAAALVAVAVAMSGCGSKETTSTASPSAKPTKIAIIAPEKGNDFGWNQQGVESARAMAQDLGVEVEVSEGAGYGDIAPIYRQLVANKADWIILWASGYNTVGRQLAQETGTKTVVIGAFEQGLVPGLCSDFETDAQEGAYLAGVVAAKMSKSGTVGIVASADDENWNKMAGGFITGARATRADIKIRFAQVGQAGYADAPTAKRVTENVIALGADIIFGMGDGSTFGMIQAVENATPPAGADKVWFIDVIGDKTSLDTKGVLLTSVVWDYLPLFKAAVAEMVAGTYGKSVGYLDLQNGGIRLLKSDKIPADVWTAVETAEKGITDGSIVVPVIYKKSDLEALIG